MDSRIADELTQGVYGFPKTAFNDTTHRLVLSCYQFDRNGFRHEEVCHKLPNAV